MKHSSIKQTYAPGPNTIESVGALIAKRRLELQLTVREVAEMAGINRTTLYRIEAGTLGDVGVVKLDRIWRALELQSALMVAQEDPNQASSAKHAQARQRRLYAQSAGELPELVRRRRQALSLSREELAELAGVSRAMLIRLEDGQVSNPGLENVENILSALGLSVQVTDATDWEPAPLIKSKLNRPRSKSAPKAKSEQKKLAVKR